MRLDFLLHAVVPLEVQVYSKIKTIKDLMKFGSLLMDFDFDIVNIHEIPDEGLFECPVNACDLYWLYKGDIYFVSVYSCEDSDCGVYYKAGRFRIKTNYCINKSYIKRILLYVSSFINTRSYNKKRKTEKMIYEGDLGDYLKEK